MEVIIEVQTFSTILNYTKKKPSSDQAIATEEEYCGVS